MKRDRNPDELHFYYQPLRTTLSIQSPLPDFLHTLPILLTIEGQGSGRQGPPPLTPPEEPANDNQQSPSCFALPHPATPLAPRHRRPVRPLLLPRHATQTHQPTTPSPPSPGSVSLAPYGGTCQ